VGVQEELQVRFAAHGVQHHIVPVDRVALGIAELVLQVHLADDPGLPGPALVAVGGGTAHPDPHLGGGVPSQDGPVVDEHHLLSETGRGHRGTDPGQATADHDHIGFYGLRPHYCSSSLWLSGPRSGRQPRRSWAACPAASMASFGLDWPTSTAWTCSATADSICAYCG